jgi:hypothetical protein
MPPRDVHRQRITIWVITLIGNELRFDAGQLARREPVTPVKDCTSLVQNNRLQLTPSLDVLGQVSQLVVGQHWEQIRYRVNLVVTYHLIVFPSIG